jgi:hypothetical protein
MLKVGEYIGKGKNRRRILEIIELSNGWMLVKTKNTKSARDFKVRTVTDPKSKHFYTPKHAHFAIDFLVKCAKIKKKQKMCSKQL